jgi:hypothetical protein
VTLKLAKPYSALAGARGGLSATASVSFSAPGQPTLRESLAVTFLRTERPPRKPSRKKTAYTGHRRRSDRSRRR